MALSPLLTALTPIAIVVLAVVLLALMGRGRKLKCPDCGTEFAAPSMDLKRSGMGWTIPFIGVVKCPKCGQTRSRRDYQKAQPQAQGAT